MSYYFYILELVFYFLLQEKKRIFILYFSSVSIYKVLIVNMKVKVLDYLSGYTKLIHMGIIIYKMLQLQNAMYLINLNLKNKTEKKGLFFVFIFIQWPGDDSFSIILQLSFKGIWRSILWRKKKSKPKICNRRQNAFFLFFFGLNHLMWRYWDEAKH